MTISTNRKANYEYHIIEQWVAGIVLFGSEVKSVRAGNVNMADSFIYMKDGEVWLKNLKIARYSQMHPSDKHEDNRDKKLLLTKKQIQKISKELQNTGITCIPLSVFIQKNKIKVNIAVVKGKKNYDKRQSIKERDIKRELHRNL
jgi:SsrA-binding protein